MVEILGTLRTDTAIATEMPETTMWDQWGTTQKNIMILGTNAEVAKEARHGVHPGRMQPRRIFDKSGKGSAAKDTEHCRLLHDDRRLVKKTTIAERHKNTTSGGEGECSPSRRTVSYRVTA
ncbi:hypothetical protein [Geobacter sulfurreducens]|uniref:hypothetical protein n=1 Tax=Geobacter sulfurreducens TaxID=35554 RepID=UPI002D1FAFD8|nr:hypothetical protein [Geobacter sulfurreducens]